MSSQFPVRYRYLTSTKAILRHKHVNPAGLGYTDTNLPSHYGHAARSSPYHWPYWFSLGSETEPSTQGASRLFQAGGWQHCPRTPGVKPRQLIRNRKIASRGSVRPI